MPPAPVPCGLVFPPPAEALLLALLVEVRELREDLARIHPARIPPAVERLSRVDVARLGRLLPAIGGALGSEPFLARDLFEHDAAALQLVLHGLNTKQIGRLLQRAAGLAVDGYLVERAGVELHAALWRVVQVSGSRGE